MHSASQAMLWAAAPLELPSRTYFEATALV
jgi:hypothetical protein